jgi:hypothetical protein
MTQLSAFPDFVPVDLAIVKVADSRHVYSKWYQDPKNTFWIPDGGSLSKKKEVCPILCPNLKFTRAGVHQLD